MKKVLVFCLVIINWGYSTAQDIPQARNDSICKLVVEYFNQKEVDKLYDLGGADFRKALSREAFQSVCEKNLFPMGPINKTTFESINHGISRYKAEFHSIMLTLFIGLDASGKLETFIFRPYTPQEAKKDYEVATSNPMKSSLDVAVDSAARPYIQLKSTVGLSIGVLWNGKKYFYGYGETKRGNKQLPNEQTLYEIGSITKTFTAILLADAVNRHLINLDDPLNKFLPDSIPSLVYDGTPITLKTLANHTSGLPRMPDNFYPSDPGDPFKDYSVADLYGFYMNFKPVRKPGEKYEYSNLGFGTLSVVLTGVFQKDYAELVREKIAGPLRMRDTKEFLDKNDSLRFATGYNENGSKSSPWEFEAMEGAGSLRSDAKDMLKYAEANLGKAPRQLEDDIALTHKVTFNDGGLKLGLAWHYIKVGDREVIFHNGETGGYHSFLAIDTDKKIAVIILSNCAQGTEDAGNSLMKWLEYQ